MSEQKRKVPQFVLPRGLVGRLMLAGMSIGHRSIYSNVAKVLSLGPGDEVLEVGCGSGHFLKKYASHARSIAGLDLSELAIAMAGKKHRRRTRAGTAQFVQGEAAALPWDGNRFSVVTSMGSFLFFPKPLDSLKEMHRVLRPGGRAVVAIEWNAEDGMDHTKELESGMRLWKEEDVRTMMKDAGFSDVSITYAKGLKMPKLMIARGLK